MPLDQAMASRACPVPWRPWFPITRLPTPELSSLSLFSGHWPVLPVLVSPHRSSCDLIPPRNPIEKQAVGGVSGRMLYVSPPSPTEPALQLCWLFKRLLLVPRPPSCTAPYTQGFPTNIHFSKMKESAASKNSSPATTVAIATCPS